jgi:heme o synthase
MPVKRTVENYWRLTKPRIWGLLVFTGIIAMVVAYRETGASPSLEAIGICFVALTLGSASADVLTNYHDRDIDAMMRRTMKRPIPNGEVDPKRALAFGLAMAVPSVLIPLFLINEASAGFMLAGLVDNIVVYSLVLKRRSWSSIILGGISGGMPVLIALYMSALVIVWIPTHIWSLAVFTRSDYEAAKIPMLPVVFGDKVASVCIAATSMMLAAFSVAIFVFTQVSVFYAISAVALGGLVIAYSAKLALDRDRKTAWTLFKITSPYLMLIFLVLGITVWV